MTSVVITAVGMALLVVSLGLRHTDGPALMTWISSWLGSALVIVGTGSLFFLER